MFFICCCRRRCFRNDYRSDTPSNVYELDGSYTRTVCVVHGFDLFFYDVHKGNTHNAAFWYIHNIMSCLLCVYIVKKKIGRLVAVLFSSMDTHMETVVHKTHKRFIWLCDGVPLRACVCKTILFVCVYIYHCVCICMSVISPCKSQYDFFSLRIHIFYPFECRFIFFHVFSHQDSKDVALTLT